MKNSQRGSLQLYLIVILLVLLAFGLGLWDIMIEREGGGWLVQIILPVVLIVILGGLYSQTKRERIALEDAEDAEASSEEQAAADAPVDTGPADGSVTDRQES